MAKVKFIAKMYIFYMLILEDYKEESLGAKSYLLNKYIHNKSTNTLHYNNKTVTNTTATLPYIIPYRTLIYPTLP